MSAIALQLVNTVRSAQYHEDMARGTLRLVAERLIEQPEEMAGLAARLEAELAIFSLEEAQVNLYQRYRLEQGHPLVQLTRAKDGVRLSILLADGRLLQAKIKNISEQLAQTTAFMLLERWPLRTLSIEDYIAKRQPYFGVPVDVLDLKNLKLSESDQARLQYGEALVRMTIEGKEFETLLQIPGTQQVLRLGPVRVFSPYSWGVLSLIAIMAALLLALGVYWVVNSFEMRLHKLERAASRLSQGHLSARVVVNKQDAISKLGQTFNQMAEYIQRLISIQREMIRAVSHELRTPVARIRFAAQIIEDGTEDRFVHQQIKEMDHDIQELDELIDEILTYARLEEGGPLLEYQRLNVAAIAQQVVVEACAPEHIQVLYLGESPEQALLAEAEPRYLHRAIQNLVSNAIRYADSRVSVVCSVTAETCRIDIEDDGSGIEPEYWDKVFVAFARLDDSRTRSSGGYGLGLSIVRRIAFWHGGQALVSRSQRLGGACFSLIWPRQQQ